MPWRAELKKAREDLRLRERRLRRRLAEVQRLISRLERILGKKVHQLSPEGRAAISRAAKKRWREYRKRR